MEDRCPKCNFTRVNGSDECSRCSQTSPQKETKEDQKFPIQFAEILVPMHKKGIVVVDSCANGERHEAMCNDCNIENCSRTNVFKYRQEVLRVKGESDRE